MIFTITDFCERVSDDMNGLIRELTQLTGRDTPMERMAWERSLPKVSIVLAEAGRLNQQLGEAHVYLGNIALEYKLPAASAWCDVVLLGRNATGQPQVLIIELKDWDTTGDEPGPSEALIMHHGQEWLHPSDQVRGYSLYCQRFHSTVHEYQALVSGCVYFTRATPIAPYQQEPHATLTQQYPVFGAASSTAALAEHVATALHEQDEEFAVAFERGVYKQDRNMLRQVAATLQQSTSRPFELLDKQRLGYELSLQTVEQASHQHGQKHVVIVLGPPGSGKSALAINLWVEAALRYNERGNVAFVSTSSSQKTNMRHLFDEASQIAGAQYHVLTSNNFNPGLYGKLVKQLQGEGYPMKPATWRQNLTDYEATGHRLKTPDNMNFLSVVDEAHALINPEGHNIGFSAGWCLQAGPQAWHIIRCSEVAVFLLDSQQSYRDNETTTPDDLRAFARELGAQVHEVDLSGAQFRCGGSKEYVDWMEGLFGMYDKPTSLVWRKTSAQPDAPFGLELVDSPAALEAVLHEHHAGQQSLVRLLSSYSVPWKTRSAPDVHNVSPANQDFDLTYLDTAGKEQRWARPWNFAPNEDYTLYVQAPAGSQMHQNPLAEVGCPYVVRGFDFDYVGLLWLDDLVWRGDCWVVQPEHVHETAFASTKSKQALKNAGGLDALLMAVLKGYRILLTRATKGVYVYVQDTETRAHLQQMLAADGDV
jgi:DUF2075 family protein